MMKFWNDDKSQPTRQHFTRERASEIINGYFNACRYMVARNKKLLKSRIKTKTDQAETTLVTPATLKDIKLQEVPTKLKELLRQEVSRKIWEF